ncbi:glycogen/starch/alpha-glucan phosphorylase [Defluviitalea raffinosedens]|uniref:Alpha-1,4 glucan phosphorylase n=1 Tax=Defluviitalea raffinosedens TaxID=1450156 RepID=A0A7C8HJ07_9FIRM|nr:glycogen/starch/alpha-glucan phosphorylase [Defluviitalea raffinosedens]KAE9635652.1 glycogen/starch/alpha-glucan family phosphorylase [Defluviitalea raffinosedens]MBM7684575.1 starch phosphorylase [Defluviitalea raffinosedens]HHW68323.1 glycogen/starch/alpha-glucan phosphorylase [Candidatus Epulonipiscium sp.]
MNLDFNKEEFKRQVLENVKTLKRKTIETATKQQIYQAVAFALRDLITDRWIATHKTYEEKDAKIVYYLSMEFLMGRALGNNLINLMAKKEVEEALAELGINYNDIEEEEPDPGLGNGGLGRLAACFLDSLATLEYPAYGCGIRYRHGIFEQKIVDGYQVEQPDNWLENGNPWEIRRSEYACEVKFGGNVRVEKKENGEDRFIQENCHTIIAVPYDIPILGYNNYTVNTLRLWDARAIIKFDFNKFDQGEYQKAVEQQYLAETIVEVLYPNDNHIQGKELRLKQQYFFVSASVQTAVKKFKSKHNDLKDLPKKIAIQMNDTHPSMAVAELMRILIDEEDLSWDEAWNITTQVCAYTNHTIMSEALEKWPVELFSRLLPRIYQIIEEINRRFCLELLIRYKDDHERIRRMAIISDGQVKMAWLAIVGSHSVNGVAALHTEILKNQELKDFYELYPHKFNNKTNGITQRRWLAKANPKLAALITDTIGDGWFTDLTELNKLVPYKENEAFRKKFMEIKYENKIKLAEYIKKHNNIEIDPNSIYDIQIKRLHEYKRQLLNVLHILYLYNQLKAHPDMDFYPRTFIFGAKAAPGYRRAKLIIKLINTVADIINKDEHINGKIKVVFVENYNVSIAEKLFPAADISEQISTASKEASGTGNMKFMLNGAVTIGTLDGANIEIKEEVGDENIFIFGLTADQVIEYYKNRNYNPWDIYNTNQDLRLVLTQLINGFLSPENPELFREIYDSLLNGGDEYFVLKDFDSYAQTHRRIVEAYKNREEWTKMQIMNVAKSGKFSSDRTIKEYAEEIWNLEPIHVSVD